VICDQGRAMHKDLELGRQATWMLQSAARRDGDVDETALCGRQHQRVRASGL
jgi:hypothetical protein